MVYVRYAYIFIISCKYIYIYIHLVFVGGLNPYIQVRMYLYAYVYICIYTYFCNWWHNLFGLTNRFGRVSSLIRPHGKLLYIYILLRSRLAVCFVSTWNHPSTIIESSSTFRTTLPNSSQISYTHLEPKWGPCFAFFKGLVLEGFFPLKMEVIWPRQRSSLPNITSSTSIQSLQSPTSDLHLIPPHGNLWLIRPYY